MNKKPTDDPPMIPSLAVKDAANAIEFYKAAFGAVELYRLTDPESGKIGHAEIMVNGSHIMLADEYPAYNKAPALLGGTPVKLCLMVINVDASVERSRSTGANITIPPKLRLQPTSQRAGRSARFSASGRAGWSSARLRDAGARTSPRLGRPRLRGDVTAGAGLCAGRSGGLRGCGIAADVTDERRAGVRLDHVRVDLLRQLVVGKLFEAPEKVGSLGISPALSQPQGCRNSGRDLSASMSAPVVGN